MNKRIEIVQKKTPFFGKGKIDLIVKDHSTGKKTKITISDNRIEHPNDIFEVTDTPEEGDFSQIKAIGEDGKSYWIKFLSEEDQRAMDEEFYADLLYPGREEKLREAEFAEKAGRYGDAADLYEAVYLEGDEELLEKARKMREKAGQIVVKRKDVSLDLNELLRQVKEGGIVVVYRCPSCAAPIRIGGDADVESLSICDHCGSEIQTVDVAEFLRTALS